MNIIALSNFDELSLIFNHALGLSGKQSEEIYHNMWCISLEANFIEKVHLEQLQHFVDKLIENRQQKLKDVNFYKSVVFYMWFDQQVLQLRFNIITGDGPLPFGCKVRVNNTPESILNNFIDTVKAVALSADQIEFFNSEDWKDEDENEEYIQDVFVKQLRATIEIYDKVK